MKTAIDDRDGDGTADERRLDVGRHIVWTFGGVSEEREVFRDQSIDYLFKVYSDIRVSVFIDG